MWVATFRNVTNKSVRKTEITWEALAERLSVHQVRTERDGPLWSPVRYKDGATRGKNGVLHVYCAVGDFEGPKVPPPEKMALSLNVLGVEFLLHSTWSHMREKHGYIGPAYRVVVPLSTPVGAEEWPERWPALNRVLFWGLSDGQTKDCSHIFYTPACPPGSEPLVVRGAGAWKNDSITEYGDHEGMRVYTKHLAEMLKIAPARIAKIDALPAEDLIKAIVSLERKVNGI